MYQQINQRRDRTQRREQPCKQQLWQRGWKDKEKTKRSKEKVDGPTRNRKAKKQQSSNRMSRVGRLLPVVITSIADFDDDDDWRRKMMHRSALVAPRRSLVGAGTLVEDPAGQRPSHWANKSLKENLWKHLHIPQSATPGMQTAESSEAPARKSQQGSKTFSSTAAKYGTDAMFLKNHWRLK